MKTNNNNISVNAQSYTSGIPLNKLKTKNRKNKSETLRGKKTDIVTP